MPEPEWREVINPHDKMFIDYADRDAARLAVLFVGNGAYGIEGEDGLPLLLFGSAEKWFAERYPGGGLQAVIESVSRERLILALRSMRLQSERSSLYDPVGAAQELADRLATAEQHLPKPAEGA